MRILLFRSLTVGAALGVGAGLAYTARFAPDALARPGHLLTAGGAIVALALLFWAERELRGAAEIEKRARVLEGQVAGLQEQVRAQSEKLRSLATMDEVTGILNRVAFLQRLDEVIQRAPRTGRPYALLLTDIQGFRGINARLGRTGGDTVLREVGRALRSVTRGTDFVGRWGGDEFVVALAECGDVHPVVSRILLALEAAGGASPEKKVRLSIGAVLAKDPARRTTPSEMLLVAEQALATLPVKGESRVCCRILGAPAGAAAAVHGSHPSPSDLVTAKRT